MKDQNTAEDLENVDSNASPAETNEDVDTQSQDGDNSPVEKELPFDKHPRWQELLAKDKLRDEELEELRNFRKQAEPVLDRFKPREQIPIWFGGDEEQWKQYKAYNTQLKQEARTEALEEIEGRTRSYNNKVEEANKHFETSVSDIESKGFTVDRNALLKIAQDYELIDAQNRWNYKAAWEILKGRSTHSPDTDSINAKKRIFGTGKETTADQGKKNYKTNADFQKERPW